MTDQALRLIHPFPARMAPDLVRSITTQLPAEAVLLDPMCGSGTVLRAGAEAGVRSYGFDVDPLAVLMSGVWTARVDPSRLLAEAHELLAQAEAQQCDVESLPWIDDETYRFICYWFAPVQRRQLAALARALSSREWQTGNALRLALSRLIVTKDSGASLARDSSHSRPHRVRLENDFDVFFRYLPSVRALASRLRSRPIYTEAKVRLGDARDLRLVPSESIDCVITSPPYLNALDYMRGHRLSLVWLGWTLKQLRGIRGDSVGAERGLEDVASVDLSPYVSDLETLPRRQQEWVRRYIGDAMSLAKEVERCVRAGAKVVFVVGNSLVRGSRVDNAQIFEDALSGVGIQIVSRETRDIPAPRRYLPPPTTGTGLNLRMRTEVVLVGHAA